MHSHPAFSGTGLVTDIYNPYPIWIIDGLFDEDFLQTLSKQWVPEDDVRWFRGRPLINGTKNILESGMLAISDALKMPPAFAELDRIVHSEEFTAYISGITGIEALLPDSAHRWSGMRTMLPGASQLIHSDARSSPATGLTKELTLLLYLNRDYDKDRDLGALEIWDDSMTHCMHEILPLWNRLVVFQNSETSYHGVPRVTGTRRMFTWSIMKNRASDGRKQAQFVARPEDPAQVGEIGATRAHLGDY